MRLVVALGGNALLRRGEPMTHATQRANVQRAARALAPLVLEHEVVLTHGNGPQIGLLALAQTAIAGAESSAGAASGPHDTRPEGVFPLDVLGAQTEGMIGYLLEQALDAVLPDERPVASLLTRIVIDRDDPELERPTKFIGPGYARREQADALAARHGWTFGRDGEAWRRVVPSPRPVELVEQRVLSLLLAHGVTVICAGGGGIPVLRDAEGNEVGVEAVIDKDHASGLIARAIGADALLLLTDVASVQLAFGTARARAIRHASPAQLAEHDFPAGSMGPKVDAARAFVEATGGIAAIGALEDAGRLLAGERGTRIDRSAEALVSEPLAPPSTDR